MLSPDWTQISENTLQLLRQNYENNGFCFETRLHLSDFIQTNFIHTEDLENVYACDMVSQLFEQLKKCITDMPNTSSTLTIKRVLQSSYDRLLVQGIPAFLDFTIRDPPIL